MTIQPAPANPHAAARAGAKPAWHNPWYCSTRAPWGLRCVDIHWCSTRAPWGGLRCVAIAGIFSSLGASAFLGPAALIGVVVTVALVALCDSCREFVDKVRSAGRPAAAARRRPAARCVRAHARGRRTGQPTAT